MNLPDYWLLRPEFDFSAQQNLLEQVLVSGLETGTINQAPIPMWAFLTWLTVTKGYLAHGTGDPSITVFEPRKADDAGEFGNQKAVYAASDGIWAMFFAILDRPKIPMSSSNAAMRVEIEPPLDIYFFSVSEPALNKRPFRTGYVYLLERQGFVQQQGFTRDGVAVSTHHWANFEAVKPRFKVLVQPQDFVFLEQIRSHDEATLWRRVEKNPNGFPWLEDE